MMKSFENLQVWVVWPTWPEFGPPSPLELKWPAWPLWEEASWLTQGWGSVLPVGAEEACIMWELRRTLMARPATGTNLLLPMLAEGEGVNSLSMAGCEAAGPSGPFVSACLARTHLLSPPACPPGHRPRPAHARACPPARTHQHVIPPVQPLLAADHVCCQPAETCISISSDTCNPPAARR
ncbi:hypothetical protein ACLOJK_022259 [Asimina triloba]